MEQYFYHYDNAQYDIGNNISKQNNIPNDIKTMYDKLTGFDSSKIVYMLNDADKTLKDEEYSEVYKYCYLVKAENAKRCLMDFSPMVLTSDIDIFIKLTGLTRNDIIKVFANIYVGNVSEDLVKYFCKMIGYSKNAIDNYEYISDNVTVIKKIKTNVTEKILESTDEIYDYGTGDIVDNNYFDITKNETSKYTDYLQNPEQTNKYYHTTSSIEMISPREYFDACADIFDSTFEKQYRQIKADTKVLLHLKDVILKYNRRFPITVLNYAENTQEGRHRMFVLGELFGWDIDYPVLVIQGTDEGHELKKQHDILQGLNRLTNKALEYTYLDLNDCVDNLKYYLNDLKDYVDYDDLDIIITKKPSIMIQVDNVSYEIEEQEIKIDPNKFDDLEDELDIDDLMLDLTDKEKEMFGIKK